MLALLSAFLFPFGIILVTKDKKQEIKITREVVKKKQLSKRDVYVFEKKYPKTLRKLKHKYVQLNY